MNNKAREQRISPATEAKVMAAVRKYGYSPNQFARGFRLKRTRTVGFIVGDVKNRFFSLLEESIEADARERGFNVIVASSNDKPDRELEALSGLFSKSVDGVIIVSSLQDTRTHETLNNRSVPLVYIDRMVKGARAQVASDNTWAAHELTTSLIQRGYKDIAYIGGVAHVSSNSERLKGFVRALKENGLAITEERIFQHDFTGESGYRSAQALFSQNTRPAAIFTAGLTLLEGLLRYYQEQGQHFGRDIRLATFDDHPFLDFFSSRIDSVAQDCAAMGKEAFALLARSMENGKLEKKTILIKPKLIIR
ncbi:MAG: hypothetical protein A2268_07915 [Candidatus Raymondbacteria bacterium RifOxyA12_full_50_37]|nr:MAG: hypothetical protein A2268_07915 [Candidatus Raymondbacteria bacterium RifOxyA12_full_50_37]OGJ98764.1 MAG: hypothetical protein A2453_09770 [Candidatus Raymondbacteria bacterium RIFOXYC2_FULL_50_21]OGK07088.1 MAG: hypothetical protein A2487_19680 [Candidatus Raymondbacteria bacterium RifOxyC12_full_50_8]